MGNDMCSCVHLEKIICLCFPICKQLVGNFQTEASQRKQESDQAATKLSSVRKLIAKLLKSINEVSKKVVFLTELKHPTSQVDNCDQ